MDDASGILQVGALFNGPSYIDNDSIRNTHYYKSYPVT